MARARQKLMAFEDTEEFGPLLMRLALKECDPGERPNVSKIIRRAIRAELVRCRMIRQGTKREKPGAVVRDSGLGMRG